MSKKQSLLMPLQELRRRSLALSLGDLPGSELWGHPGGDRATSVLPWRGGDGLGGALGTAWGLLCWPEGWQGEHSNLWEAEEGGFPSRQTRSFEQIFISIFPCTSRAAPLPEQRSALGRDGMETRSAQIVPSSAPSLAPPASPGCEACPQK